MKQRAVHVEHVKAGHEWQDSLMIVMRDGPMGGSGRGRRYRTARGPKPDGVPQAGIVAARPADVVRN
ncbi:hypothetical protein Pdca_20860 [Pseudonocardia autotrophica]|nr:hypothetical protein Pdca_20860 [Pseudonocardia autotrophica]